MAIKLERPIVFFDLETTGTNVLRDRIVEISLIKVYNDGRKPVEYVRRVNPGIPIPAEATAVHHITDDDVKNEKPFKDIAQGIADTLKDCDIAGFNSTKFDLPLLIEEMSRANVMFNRDGINIVDVQNIYHKKEPRNLSAAYRFYCDKNLEDAHSALADTRATCEIFFAQSERYDDLPDTMAGLAEFSSYTKMVDLSGFFSKNDKGEYIFNFGKHKGKSIAQMAEKNKDEVISYLDWMIQGEFPMETKTIATKLKNKYSIRK